MPNNLQESKHWEGEQIGLDKEVEVLIFELTSAGQEKLSPYAYVDNLNRGSHSNEMGRSPAVNSHDAEGTQCGLCIAWKRSYSKNHVDVIVKEEANSSKWRLMGFYDYKKEELYLALKGMGPTKASRIDGFPTLFFSEVLAPFISMTIANRLPKVLELCIDEAYSAFVLGWLITDNVMLSYEILHTFKNKRMGKKGYSALKLDMSNACNSVE
ncbi:reverse transcriptase [Gossypium australe]|uniref:Reverse transcriptase n=1 Tax=Gossypium australe TaxID=47621 RepID=A0A5B6VP49_9ROSI|nr:reverse transcriptase [Gossypium australe]